MTTYAPVGSAGIGTAPNLLPPQLQQQPQQFGQQAGVLPAAVPGALTPQPAAAPGQLITDAAVSAQFTVRRIPDLETTMVLQLRNGHQVNLVAPTNFEIERVQFAFAHGQAVNVSYDARMQVIGINIATMPPVSPRTIV